MAASTAGSLLSRRLLALAYLSSLATRYQAPDLKCCPSGSVSSCCSSVSAALFRDSRSSTYASDTDLSHCSLPHKRDRVNSHESKLRFARAGCPFDRGRRSEISVRTLSTGLPQRRRPVQAKRVPRVAQDCANLTGRGDERVFGRCHPEAFSPPIREGSTPPESALRRRRFALEERRIRWTREGRMRKLYDMQSQGLPSRQRSFLSFSPSRFRACPRLMTCSRSFGI